MTTPDKKVATLQQSDKAKAFDSLRNNKYPIDPNFRWICQDTQQMAVTEMSTFHLFNSLKMIWNHTMPEQYIIEPLNHRYNLRGMRRTYRKRAVANLFNELMNRPDRTKGMEDAMRRMAQILHDEGKRLLA